MRIRNTLVLAGMVTALAAPGTAALASPPNTFGSHVRDCTQMAGFSGSHNPGTHRGASGWDGSPCQ